MIEQSKMNKVFKILEFGKTVPCKFCNGYGYYRFPHPNRPTTYATCTYCNGTKRVERDLLDLIKKSD